MVKCQVVMDALDTIAPRHLAEDWDNVGLLLGNPAAEVHKIFVCLDVSEDSAHMAVAQGCDMIVSHHPLLFKPLRNLRTDRLPGRLLKFLLQQDMTVFSAHTNLDIAAGGVNDVLAARLGLGAIRPFAVTAEEELVKLVVFVPEPHAAAVRQAIGDAGAGHLGRYSHCSFSVPGEGCFLPLTGAMPFIGRQGELTSVAEVKLETILPVRLQNKVVRAMLKAHPYEEVAYDVYPLKNKGESFSLGRIGELDAPLDIDVFARVVKEALPGSSLRLARGGDKRVRRVALCSGSGAEFIDKAVYMGADAYVTGDVKYHDAQKAKELGIHVIDAGHFGTEMPVVPVLVSSLREYARRGKWQVEIVEDTGSRDPFELL